MTRGKLQRELTSGVWGLAHDQHGVVSRRQLRELGLSDEAIDHRIAKGRLHRLWRGIYAVGRPEVSQEGRWMAAVMSCGPAALLSHGSAAALWGIMRRATAIDVVVPEGTYRRRPGIRVHRRSGLKSEQCRKVVGIPVTDPVSTLVDVASQSPDWVVGRALNEADRLDLVDLEVLRATIDLLPSRPGMGRMRRLLGGRPLTDTNLESRFLAVARLAGMPPPETQVVLNGYRVDFYWRDLRLVVEADGWRHHRTPGEQANDRRRDQVHAMAGLTTLRFAEEQIRDAPDEVKRTLSAVSRRLARSLPA